MSLAKKGWVTKKAFANLLGVTIGNFNQLMVRGPKDKLFPKPGSQYCRREGKRNLYSPEYVEMVKAGRKTMRVRSSSRSAQNAKLVVTVPIFDELAAALLIKKFKSAEGIKQYLREKLTEVYEPALAKIADMEAEFQRRKQSILEAGL